jgi:hypothetical protein
LFSRKFAAVLTVFSPFTTVDLHAAVSAVFAATAIVSAHTIVVNEAEPPNVGCLFCLQLSSVVLFVNKMKKVTKIFKKKQNSCFVRLIFSAFFEIFSNAELLINRVRISFFASSAKF